MMIPMLVPMLLMFRARSLSLVEQSLQLMVALARMTTVAVMVSVFAKVTQLEVVQLSAVVY